MGRTQIMTHTKTPDWSELKRLAEAAGQGKDAEDVSWNDIRFRDAANPATVLELIAEVERLRANAEKMEKLYRGLSVERGDLQTEFIEMRSERDALKSQVAEERDWQNEIRKVCKEAMGGNTTFIDDDVARAITALKSQRDEMAEALGWIEAQAKAFAQSKMSEQTRSGIRASAWNWVFAVEQKVADIQRRARSSLNKEKTDG